MKINIIAETNRWIAISKPPGIQVERNPFGSSAESLVYDHLSKKYRNPYVGIVHRIDRPTSGLVLIAKKKSTLRQLNQHFSQKDINKQYLARVAPVPAQPEGQLEHWLKKDRKEKRTSAHSHKVPESKYSVLQYRLLQTYEHDQALLLIQPETGRYHQIRAQLAAIHCPVVGDEKYGSQLPYKPNCIMLHAWKLDIPGLEMALQAAPPDWAENI